MDCASASAFRFRGRRRRWLPLDGPVDVCSATAAVDMVAAMDSSKLRVSAADRAKVKSEAEKERQAQIIYGLQNK